MKALQIIFGILASAFLVNGMTMILGFQPQVKNGVDQFFINYMAGMICSALYVIMGHYSNFKN